jgi:cyclic dehypoxanthinyl futalosine synthase
MTVNTIANKVAAGERIDAAEALELYAHAPTALLGRLADDIRARKHPGRVVTYIIDRNVNYTNICVARCNFCAFYRPVGSGDGYVLGFEEIFRRSTRPSRSAAASCCCRAATTRTCRSSGKSTCSRPVKSRYPAFRLHALSPPKCCTSRGCRAAGA